MPSTPTDVITTVVYGTAATIIGVVTIYQSYMAWRLWREHHHESGHSSQDVELALGSATVVQEPSSTATVDVVHTLDMTDVQAVANRDTAPTPQQPGSSDGSTT